MTKYPEIKTKPIPPEQKFDLIENRNRGILAEFIVKRALMIDSSTRLEWDSYDLIAVDNCKIEIKSAAYIQAWKQKKKSVISFDIAPKSSLQEDNSYSEHKTRHSEIYVFCLLDHCDQETINPMNLNQWTFFIVPTIELNKKLGAQKSLSVSTIELLKHKKCDYGELRKEFDIVKSTLPNIR